MATLVGAACSQCLMVRYEWLTIMALAAWHRPSLGQEGECLGLIKAQGKEHSHPVHTYATTTRRLQLFDIYMPSAACRSRKRIRRCTCKSWLSERQEALSELGLL